MYHKKILIIDDEQGINEVLKIILEENNYVIKICLKAEKFLEEIKVFEPNLILLDAYMPNISGTEISKQLKKNKETGHIPIVILSASTRAKEICEEARADGFLNKPFEMEELLNKIDGFLR